MHGHELTHTDLNSLERDWTERLLTFFYLLSADQQCAEDMTIETTRSIAGLRGKESLKNIAQFAVERARRMPRSRANRRDRVAFAVASLAPDERLILASIRGLRLSLQDFCDITGTAYPCATRQLAIALRELRLVLTPAGATKAGDHP